MNGKESASENAGPSTCGEGIHIKDIRFTCVIGIRQCERRRRQPVSVDISLALDLRDAALNDEISETVDYSHLVRRVIEEGKKTRYYLLEALAQRIADICLDGIRIRRVTVSVSKRRKRRSYREARVTVSRQRS